MSATDPLAEAARRARSAQPAWVALGVRRRLRFVRAFRHLLVRNCEDLCDTANHDVARPAAEVLASELVPVAAACRFLERNAESVLRPRMVGGGPVWLGWQADTVYRRPHGVVGVIGTWNYPIFLNAVPILQSLTAGNAVMWKPSELAQASAGLLHRLLLEAGFAPDVTGLLPVAREAGAALAEADVDHVVFTGSAEVGRSLAARLGERLVSSTLELSGCDAMFVLPDADVELAARAAWFAAMLNRGQTCMAVRRAFVAHDLYQQFLALLRPLVNAAIPVELALESQAVQAREWVRAAVALGAHPLTDVTPTAGRWFCPTVLEDARPSMAVCREAPFAPLLAVMPFRDIDEALLMNAECPYGLTAAVFTRDAAGPMRAAAGLADRLRVGTVTVNDVILPTAHPGTPFGGRGASGWGVTQGAEGLLAQTVPQTVSLKTGKFCPHYDLIGAGDDPALADAVRGLLELSHARRLRDRVRGLVRMLRGGRSWQRRQKQ
jgi:acyl-CoA reductase-like NAD-dependent aldehyde dehydrogenase